MHGIYKNSWGKTECKRKQGSTKTGVRDQRKETGVQGL
jgi:hypothetical protein